MTLHTWDDDTTVAYDRALWGELTTLAFVEHHHGAFILGPVGVGKTHLAHALGHIACRRRLRVHADRADRLFKRLKAARLDASYEQEMRRLIAVDLLIIDDFALQTMGTVETADFYEICVEVHLTGSTLLTSNREPP